MLGIIKRNFKHLTIQSFTLLYKNMVRSHLDYCSCMWSPYMKDIEALEKVQKRAIKILPQLKHMNYSDRLKACKLPTLHYRRIWGDMIEMYKILTGKYIETAPSLVGVCSSLTRGHSLRLEKKRTKYDLCKFCFANRKVNIWNSLPSYVVSAENVNCFKIRLDSFWLNQDIIYNFCSEIHGTGSRSEIIVKSSLE